MIVDTFVPSSHVASFRMSSRVGCLSGSCVHVVGIAARCFKNKGET
jgi:hypothetical protein